MEQQTEYNGKTVWYQSEGNVREIPVPEFVLKEQTPSQTSPLPLERKIIEP